MKALPLFLLALAVFAGSCVRAQPKAFIETDLADQPQDLSDLPFYVSAVKDATGTDGEFGNGFTGLLNRPKPIRFKEGLELNLLAALLRSSINTDGPPATLTITGLRIDELITLTSENRYVQVEGFLEVAGVHHGPLSVAEIQWGGTDATDSHAYGVTKVVAELLARLAASPPGRPVVVDQNFPIASQNFSDLPDGVYHSLFDFRAGKVDTSLQFITENIRPLRAFEGTLYHFADLKRPAKTRRKDAKKIWGYQSGGKSFLQIRGSFFEIRRDETGEFLAALPESLYAPGTEASGGQLIGGALFGIVGSGLVYAVARDRPDLTLFKLDMRTGNFTPLGISK